MTFNTAEPTDRTLDFPLRMRMKIISVANQFYVTDARGKQVAYVRQKLFKLKESIQIYSDDSKDKLLYNIKADNILDFSGSYYMARSDASGLGFIYRKGLKSLWRAEYEVCDQQQNHTFTIQQNSGWLEVIDGLISEIPVVGMLSGYFINPSYHVTRTSDGKKVMVMKKKPSFFERMFDIERNAKLSPAEEEQLMLALFMVVVLERDEG